jgi:hypothetical protein
MWKRAVCEEACSVGGGTIGAKSDAPKACKILRVADVETLNTEDPIMFEPLGLQVYIFNRPCESGKPGSRVAFNLESLVDYLVCSGRFQDPVSRLPFSESDLIEIDALVRS